MQTNDSLPKDFTDAFVEGFINETKDHLDSINNHIINLKTSPKDKESLQALLRDVHTIKGTSRMMGFNRIEQLSHGIEDVFKGIREEKYEITDQIVRLTFATIDCINNAISRIKKDGNDEINIESFLEAYRKASGGLFFNVENLEKEAKGISVQSSDGQDNEDFDIENLENIRSIRIDIDRINEIIKSFDNIIIRQFRFKHQLEQFERRLSTLETSGIRKIPKQLTEDLMLTEDAIFKTQHQLLNLRMMPLEIIMAPLKREIQKDSIMLEKNVVFDVPSTDFMLDKIILEQLKEILLHLVRNCLDHGIENEEERTALGKNPQGKISIIASSISNYIVINVSDDGRGIQYEKIRQKAQLLNPSQAQEIQAMSEKDLQQYIFMSGFTTKENATEISGRGVGLDIVRTDMEKIKGKIRINSTEGKGTSFELTIPLSLATQQGLFIISSGMKFLVPSHYIQKIMDYSSAVFMTMQGQRFISVGNQLIPIYYLSTILGSTSSENCTSVIIVEYLETLMAIAVESIKQYENVVVNPLPPLMENMTSLQGVVYDEDYAIISILNIPVIMQKMRKLVAYDIHKYEIKNEETLYKVLIVDDSSTTRQIEKTIFEVEGYLVDTATDGIDALEKLNDKHYDIIVTDISMPRMDGAILLSNIRRIPQYENIPVIVVSGAYDEQQEKMMMDSGAQMFIVKSEFERGNLMKGVRELLKGGTL